jgi:hypothetical protein
MSHNAITSTESVFGHFLAKIAFLANQHFNSDHFSILCSSPYPIHFPCELVTTAVQREIQLTYGLELSDFHSTATFGGFSSRADKRNHIPILVHLVDLKLDDKRRSSLLAYLSGLILVEPIQEDYHYPFILQSAIPLSHSTKALDHATGDSITSNLLVHTIISVNLDDFRSYAQDFIKAHAFSTDIYCTAQPCDSIGVGFICQFTFQENGEVLSTLTLPDSAACPCSMIVQSIRPNLFSFPPSAYEHILTGFDSGNVHRSLSWMRSIGHKKGNLDVSRIQEYPCRVLCILAYSFLTESSSSIEPVAHGSIIENRKVSTASNPVPRPSSPTTSTSVLTSSTDDRISSLQAILSNLQLDFEEFKESTSNRLDEILVHISDRITPQGESSKANSAH